MSKYYGTFWGTLALLFVFIAAKNTFAQKRPYTDILVYKNIYLHLSICKEYVPTDTNFVALDMDFASTTIDSLEKWQNNLRRFKEPVAVDIVYSQYPKDTSKWFSWFYKNRVNKLLQMDASLASPLVTWNLVAQTGASRLHHAKKLFHGVYIYYKTDENPTGTTLSNNISPEAVDSSHKTLPNSYKFDNTYLSGYMDMVCKVINGQFKLSDSTVFKVLARNPNWKDMLVVIDWTGSMYTYGAQLLRWQYLHFENQALKELVFFNDGNDFVRRLEAGANKYYKELGRAGGIYPMRADSFQLILDMMHIVMKNGDGADTPENNIEAIVEALESYPNHTEVFMIADNLAPVRDIALLNRIKVPVHIILCGAMYAPPHPHYVQIAWQTGGSIHALEKDLIFDAPKKATRRIKFMDYEYYFGTSGNIKLQDY